MVIRVLTLIMITTSDSFMHMLRTFESRQRSCPPTFLNQLSGRNSTVDSRLLPTLATLISDTPTASPAIQPCPRSDFGWP